VVGGIVVLVVVVVVVVVTPGVGRLRRLFDLGRHAAVHS